MAKWTFKQIIIASETILLNLICTDPIAVGHQDDVEVLVCSGDRGHVHRHILTVNVSHILTAQKAEAFHSYISKYLTRKKDLSFWNNWARWGFWHLNLIDESHRPHFSIWSKKKNTMFVWSKKCPKKDLVMVNDRQLNRAYWGLLLPLNLILDEFLFCLHDL